MPAGRITRQRRGFTASELWLLGKAVKTPPGQKLHCYFSFFKKAIKCKMF
jgi:hypothetical protein